MATIRPNATPRALPRGVLAGTVVGATAGAVAWASAGIVTHFAASGLRADQLDMLWLTAWSGAAVLALRARRIGEASGLAAGFGAVLAGVPALAAVTVASLVSHQNSVAVFLIVRIVAWSLSAALGVAVVIGVYTRPTRRVLLESVCLAAMGGAVAAIVYTLPGPTAAWQGVAFTLFGAVIGWCVTGPELWDAPVVVESLPARGALPTLLDLREWPLYPGDTIPLGETRVACVEGVATIYPAASGIVANGRHVSRALGLPLGGTLQIGRSRYRIRAGSGTNA